MNKPLTLEETLSEASRLLTEDSTSLKDMLSGLSPMALEIHGKNIQKDILELDNIIFNIHVHLETLLKT